MHFGVSASSGSLSQCRGEVRSTPPAGIPLQGEGPCRCMHRNRRLPQRGEGGVRGGVLEGPYPRGSYRRDSRLGGCRSPGHAAHNRQGVYAAAVSNRGTGSSSSFITWQHHRPIFEDGGGELFVQSRKQDLDLISFLEIESSARPSVLSGSDIRATSIR